METTTLWHRKMFKKFEFKDLKKTDQKSDLKNIRMLITSMYMLLGSPGMMATGG